MTAHHIYRAASVAATILATVSISAAAHAQTPIYPCPSPSYSSGYVTWPFPAAGVPGQLLGDPSAEQDPAASAWTSDGFTSEPYGSSPDLPSAAFATNDGLGERLFVAQHPGARLEQTVAIAPLVDGVLTVAAHVGGAADPAGLPQLAVQWLDADRQFISDGEAPKGAGYCPEKDGQTFTHQLWVNLGSQPPEARFARVSVTAPPTAAPGVASYVDGWRLQPVTALR